MNRIVLIGNGFDLAHGLPTSYRNFIENYWGNIINKVHDTRKVYEDECIHFSTDVQTLAHIVSKNTEYSIKGIEEQVASFKKSLYGTKARIR
ncbi:AbiH family protein, partial [Dysgonomonas sp. 520]|uniref:AbiH family protein n=1 Tax=Dysgonomonas sp. 520 TaxID=2302931 RepID=UPI001C8725CD